jgi:ATP-dependent Lhr-like helicase
VTKSDPPAAALPARFTAWFEARGWQPRAHQLALLAAAQAGEDALLIAPTGAGKTLAGFLPSLVDLTERPRNRRGLHTLYVSPLKALAVDVERNLGRPVADLRLGVAIETRTGDTSVAKRKRQRERPPDILLTTPEQVALLLASPDSWTLFADLRRIVFDELHAIVAGKRGDLLCLDLARLRRIAPMMRATGLSATVRDPAELQRWLVGQPARARPLLPLAGEGGPAKRGRMRGGAAAAAVSDSDPTGRPDVVGPPSPAGGRRTSETSTQTLARLVVAPPGAPADLKILDTEQRMPWSGHSARHALGEVYAAIRGAGMTLIFTNTRSQAEFIFQTLWAMNDDNLPIALHHGSLDASQRRRVEEAMAAGRLKAVVCTSTLDLGIDWGDVDLVINIGAPKGSSRLMQRIGRANHRLDEPSRALLVPSNRFEVLECRAAVDAAAIGAQDTAVARAGALDVMCQHILGMACAGPFAAEELYTEITSAEPYREVSRETFDKALAFVAHGGYALAGYERFAKIKEVTDEHGEVRWRVANGRVAQAYRMNVGTIVEASSLKVRLVRGRKGGGDGQGASQNASEVYTGPLRRGGRVLGELEEGFLETLAPGDTFLFGGEVLALQAIVENEALVSRARSDTPRVPTYAGGKFPLSTYLAEGVRNLLADPNHWDKMPMQVAEWLELQRERSALPPPGDLLVETFPRGNRFYLVCYPFEGRLAHQTLGMLLTRRMERAHLRPLGFVATDYVMAVWGKTDVGLRARQGLVSIDDLFSQDMLGDDLEDWLQDSALMKRTFRQNAIVSGLIERNFPGKEKTGRQITVSTDLIYDVLRRHEPDHILLQAARADASTGLLDLVRLAAMLSRVKGRILHKDLDRISPLAVPIMLEVGREPIHGEGRDAILAEAEAELVREVMG